LSAATLEVYTLCLRRLAEVVPAVRELTPLNLTRFFTALKDRPGRPLKPNSLHQAFRVVRTFIRWTVAIGAVTGNPLAGLTMRTPQTLPVVPSEAELKAVLAACPLTPEGRRNRAMPLVLADSGLRQGEMLRLLIEHVDLARRTLLVRMGKGAKDRVASVLPTTVRALRGWLAVHPAPHPESFLFCYADGRPMTKRHVDCLCHRLSAKAKLAPARRLRPHPLRAFAATSWIRNGMGLDEVRRLLGHTTVSTTLRYSALVAADVHQAHQRAAALERMNLGD
jgi:integrase/recombinase XerD